jgi:hypothetical protein
VEFLPQVLNATDADNHPLFSDQPVQCKIIQLEIINLQIDFSTSGELVASVTAFIGCLISVMTPTLSVIIISKYWKEGTLLSEEFSKYSTLIEGVRLDSFFQAQWNVIALTKMLVTVSLIVFLRQTPCFQLISIYFL